MARYDDISHFRAPYKNSMRGFGADPSDPAAQLVVVEPSGVRVFKPEVAAVITKGLEGHSVIMLGSEPDDVKMDVRLPAGDIREQASAWVARKLAEGKSVLIGSPAGYAAAAGPTGIPGADKLLKAVKGQAGELAAAGPSALPFYALLQRSAVAAKPEGKGLFASLGPIGIGAVVLGVVGAAILIGRKKRSS